MHNIIAVIVRFKIQKTLKCTKMIHFVAAAL